MNQRTGELLQRAYALADTSEAKSLYDEWAGAYDADLNTAGYASPRRSVEAIVKNLSSTSDELRILDAGCGTGLVGDCLARSPLAGRFVLHGVDLSPGMLEAAREKGIYRDLEAADLNEKLDKPDENYDVIVCVGTLTKGHVGPKVFAEFARLTSRSGIVVATVHGEIWETDGYKKEIQSLGNTGVVKVVSTEEFGILEEQNEGGRMVILRKL